MVFSQCSPFLEMMENLQKPLHPSGEVSALHPLLVPTLVRSSYLCGVTTASTGKKLPKVSPPATPRLPGVLSLGSPQGSQHGGAGGADRCPGGEGAAGVCRARGEEQPADEQEVRGGHAAQDSGGEGGGAGPGEQGGHTNPQFPWLVNLGFRKRGSSGLLYKCGGTLISSRWGGKENIS